MLQLNHIEKIWLSEDFHVTCVNRSITENEDSTVMTTTLCRLEDSERSFPFPNHSRTKCRFIVMSTWVENEKSHEMRTFENVVDFIAIGATYSCIKLGWKKINYTIKLHEDELTMGKCSVFNTISSIWSSSSSDVYHSIEFSLQTSPPIVS